METFVRKALTVVLLISSLAIPTTSHAWFFFLLPGGLFSNNDKKTVAELEQKQDWKGLLELADKRLATNDKDAGWLYINGYALMKLDRCIEAIPQFKRSLESKSDNNAAENNLGTCQLSTGQLDDAKSTFTSLMARSPDYWQVYYNLGLVFVRKSDPANARTYLEQLKPRNMAMAIQLQDHIQQVETRLERERIAAEDRAKVENERIERERVAKEEADAKAKAEAEANANAAAEQSRLTAVQAAKISQKSMEEQLTELKLLYTKGLITKEVYNARQKEILARH